MREEKIKRFIDVYSKFYFTGDISKKEFEDRGIPTDLNRTDLDLENYIEKKIKEGIYDAEAFAWKAGKAIWNNGKVDYVSPLPDKWVNGNGGEIKENKEANVFSKQKFEEYLSENPVDASAYKFDSAEGRRELYLDIIKKYDLYNYGTVNIINQMFFLSQGAIPVYDYYANVAAKALYMEKSPLEIFVAEAPQKDAHPKGKKIVNGDYYMALNVLEEYMWLLKKVFPSEMHKDGDKFYISRSLDQALWVYGHATKKYND